MTEIRRAAERGCSRLEWLDSRHSFALAHYVDRDHLGFGPLRVVNEDWVAPGSGEVARQSADAGDGVALRAESSFEIRSPANRGIGVPIFDLPRSAARHVGASEPASEAIRASIERATQRANQGVESDGTTRRG